jgi:DNA-binding PadR family transcriptional regulator
MKKTPALTPGPVRQMSELECFALGLVWRYGPCTPYTIRRRLMDSPSTQWSGSAGAIYPLLQRLEGQKLVRSRAAATGERRSRQYRVTPRGMEALRKWVGPPLAAEAVTVSYDPLRSRIRFVDILPAADRRVWLAAARKALEEVLERVRHWEALHAADDEPLAAILTRSGELDVQARLRWLAEAERVVVPKQHEARM